jgi:hypothetical protein
MNVFKQALAISAVIVMVISNNSFSNDISVLDNTEAQPEIVAWQEPRTGFSGRIRVGYISIENEVDSESSAVGAELHYASESWQGISANGSLYATNKIFQDEEASFFGSDGNGYVVLGQAYLKTSFEKTEVKLGRFSFDSPHAGMNDVRIIPNTFSGILIDNTDIDDTTLYAAHLTKWISVDSTKPENFTDILGSDNVNVLGVVYQGIDNIDLQTWYYNAKDLADFFYADATFNFNNLTLGTQLGKQSDRSDDNSGPNGDVYGIMASYTLNNFTFKSSYNHVSGTVINGFGGGPFYTSAADHTISDELDQSAFAIGIDYAGFNNLILGVLNVDFDKGANELDFFVSYDFGNKVIFDFIYHHIHEDGKMILAMFNVGF